jgi:uncharacterized membrane protein (UPF0127 family)
MRAKLLIVLLILLSLGLAGCQKKDMEPVETIIEGTDFRLDAFLSITSESDAPKASYEVEIATTSKAAIQGLMYRESMAENQGMLFDPEGASDTAFWMKNTYIPLDIIFIDINKRISYIVENTVPFSEELIEAPAIYRYVLELNAGQTKKKELTIGDKIKWIENTSE